MFGDFCVPFFNFRLYFVSEADFTCFRLKIITVRVILETIKSELERKNANTLKPRLRASQKYSCEELTRLNCFLLDLFV